MISTGIDALDHRLGGLLAGRYYLISGAPGAGKTSVVLHFVGAGLETGETCAILTQEDPGDLLAQAEFLGFDFRGAAESEQLIVLQYRLDFAHNLTRLADPERLVEELRSLSGDRQPSRFAIDSISPFIDTGGTAHDTMSGLAHLLDHLEATTYLTIPGDLSDIRFWTTLERVRASSAGIFHVQVESGKVREFTIRKVRQAATSTEPFRFTIRPGLGIVAMRDNARSIDEVSPELRRKLVVLSTSAALPEAFQLGLENAYDVCGYTSVESAFAELSSGDFGALILTFDPREPAPAIALTRELRRSGHGAPILFLSSSEELRASTRAKALRAGGDDFLTEDLPLQDFLERVEVARVRGYRLPSDSDAVDNALVQPTDDAGDPQLLEEAEIRRAVQHQVTTSSHPFFAVCFLGAHDFAPEIWRVLCEELRVREGDLVGRASDGRLVVYLHDVSRRDVRELLGRIVETHPEFAMVEDVVVYSYPADRSEIESWLNPRQELQRAGARP